VLAQKGKFAGSGNPALCTHSPTATEFLFFFFFLENDLFSNQNWVCFSISCQKNTWRGGPRQPGTTPAKWIHLVVIFINMINFSSLILKLVSIQADSMSQVSTDLKLLVILFQYCYYWDFITMFSLSQLLRQEQSSLPRTLGWWVRIPLNAWMCVCSFNLCAGSGLATGWSSVQGVLVLFLHPIEDMNRMCLHLISPVIWTEEPG
jgi:hypothetical protein